VVNGIMILEDFGVFGIGLGAFFCFLLVDVVGLYDIPCTLANTHTGLVFYSVEEGHLIRNLR
jgi:hypothetical protein